MELMRLTGLIEGNFHVQRRGRNSHSGATQTGGATEIG